MTLSYSLKMDLMITEHDLGEGTPPDSALKKEELIDIKYEDNSDPVPSSEIPNDKVSFILKYLFILHERLMWVLGIFFCSDL
jgi:hypothetical protein